MYSLIPTLLAALFSTSAVLALPRGTYPATTRSLQTLTSFTTQVTAQGDGCTVPSQMSEERARAKCSSVEEYATVRITSFSFILLCIMLKMSMRLDQGR